MDLATAAHWFSRGRDLPRACGSKDAPVGTSTEHPSHLRVRLAVADDTTASLVVYDVADREIAGRLSLDGPAESVVSSYTGQTALALRRGHGEARVLSGGVSVIPHKDHIHIFKSRPALRGPTLTSIAPSSVPITTVFGDERWGVGFEDDARALVGFGEEAWLQAKYPLTSVASTIPG